MQKKMLNLEMSESNFVYYKILALLTTNRGQQLNILYCVPIYTGKRNNLDQLV